MRPVDHARVAAGAFAGILGTAFVFLAVGLVWWLPRQSHADLKQLAPDKPQTTTAAWQSIANRLQNNGHTSLSRWTGSVNMLLQQEEIPASAIVGSTIAAYGARQTKLVRDPSESFELRLASDVVIEYRGAVLLLKTTAGEIKVETMARGFSKQELRETVAQAAAVDAQAVTGFVAAEQGQLAQGPQTNALGFSQNGRTVILQAHNRASQEILAIGNSFRWLK